MMSTTRVQRKVRGNAVLHKLKEEEQEEAFIYVEAHTLAEAKTWLHSRFGIMLNGSSISTWATRKRTEKANFEFHRLLGEIKTDAARANLLEQKLGDLSPIRRANVNLLSQELFRALVDQNENRTKRSARLLAPLIEALAKQNSAEAALVRATVARARFQFDAAKAALRSLTDLQEVIRLPLDEKEMCERVVKLLFGDKPDYVKTAGELLA